MFLASGDQDRAIWLEAAANPELAAVELQVGGLVEVQSQQSLLGDVLQKYYWNTSVPFTTFEDGNRIAGREDMRMSFVWDRPRTKYGRPLFDNLMRRGRFENDRIERGKVVHDISAEVQVTEKDGKQYLVSDKKHVISPKFDEVTPMDDGRFAVCDGERTGIMRLLTADEQQEVQTQRKQYDELDGTYMDTARELHSLQYRAALATLALHGVSLDGSQINSSANTQNYRFKYAGSQVLMGVHGSMLKVIAWDEALTHEQRHQVWRAYEGADDSVRSAGMQLEILKDAIERGVPDFLKPYEDRIMAEIEDIDAASRFFLAAMRDLFERNSFRPFIIETPHTSWSIPVAMKLIEMPFEDAFAITAPFGTVSRGHLRQDRPGQFSGGYEPGLTQSWVLDDTNALKEK